VNVSDAPVIPIVLATDSRFVPYCSVTISSIIANASPEREYRIYVFHEGLPAAEQAIFETMSTVNIRIDCLDASAHIRPDVMYAAGSAYPRSIYFRLFIPEMLPMFEKVLYLDSDVVAATDVAELWETDITGAIVGAVRDCPHNKEQLANFRTLGLADEKYFNSGVLLVNCQAFKDERIKEKCCGLLSRYRDLHMPDQDALNLFCMDKVVYLPMRWNLMVNYARKPLHVRDAEKYGAEFDEGMDKPGIIHFSGDRKPLLANYLKHDNIFWQYAAGSPLFPKMFREWNAAEKRILFPGELFKIIDAIVATGQSGWRGLLSTFWFMVRSRIHFLRRLRERKR
jgi:lipopolysaccharide biosynthesis glycosyltransferase